MKCKSDIKRNEGLIQAATRKSPKTYGIKATIHKGPHILLSIYLKYPQWTNPDRHKQSSGCQGLGREGKGEWLLIGSGFFLG